MIEPPLVRRSVQTSKSVFAPQYKNDLCRTILACCRGGMVAESFQDPGTSKNAGRGRPRMTKKRLNLIQSRFVPSDGSTPPSLGPSSRRDRSFTLRIDQRPNASRSLKLEWRKDFPLCSRFGFRCINGPMNDHQLPHAECASIYVYQSKCLFELPQSCGHEMGKLKTPPTPRRPPRISVGECC